MAEQSNFKLSPSFSLFASHASYKNYVASVFKSLVQFQFLLSP